MSRPTPSSSTTGPASASASAPTASSASSSTSSSALPLNAQAIQSQLSSSLRTLTSNYAAVPPRLKLIDSFLLFLMVSGIMQFVYRVVVTSFPYNAFLGGFGATVGQFVLLAGLRAQVAPGRDGEFKSVSQERAFADFCAASVVLHLFAYNFLG